MIDPNRVAPHEYNREERRKNSRRGSRYSSRNWNWLKKSRKLTLIDMLLLVVMGGVLLPFLLNNAENSRVGPYRYRLEQKHLNDSVAVTLTIYRPRRSALSFSGDGDSLTDNAFVGWIIYNLAGEILKESLDLPPGAGDERFFSAVIAVSELGYCEIIIENERIRHELTMPDV